MLKIKQTNKLGNILKEKLLNEAISSLQPSPPSPQAQTTEEQRLPLVQGRMLFQVLEPSVPYNTAQFMIVSS